MPSLRAYSAGSFLVYWLLLVLKLNPVQKFALRTEVMQAAINSCEPNHWHTDRQREWTNSYSIYCAMCVCCMKWRGWWKPILFWLLFDRTKRKMNDFIFIIKQIKARIWRWTIKREKIFSIISEINILTVTAGQILNCACIIRSHADVEFKVKTYDIDKIESTRTHPPNV